jgi:hypothetical protein
VLGTDVGNQLSTGKFELAIAVLSALSAQADWRRHPSRNGVTVDADAALERSSIAVRHSVHLGFTRVIILASGMSDVVIRLRLIETFE